MGACVSDPALAGFAVVCRPVGAQMRASREQGNLGRKPMRAFGMKAVVIPETTIPLTNSASQTFTLLFAAVALFPNLCCRGLLCS